MSRSMPVPMEDRALPAEFSLGPLNFTNADQFPLSELYCNVQDNEIVLRMNAEFDSSSAWRGMSMVVFFMYRLPTGREEFEEETSRYREDAKAKVKLPDKCSFDETSLALSDVPEGWEHDCFACANRNLFHVYQSEKAGVMIRLMSKKGTMLDHPLLSLVQRNVRLIDDQWVTEAPQTVQTGVSSDDEEESENREIDLKLDLRVEKVNIQKYLKSRVAAFDPETNYGPGDGQTISAIDVGYDCSQGGWVTVIFDTRDAPEPDGQWTTFLDEENLYYSDSDWAGLAEAIWEDQSVVVTRLDGIEQTVSEDTDVISELLGEMLKELLFEARTSGLLGKLPTAEKCYLGVEDFNGVFGWPEYEQRDAEGLL